jgi:hypothetical protein
MNGVCFTLLHVNDRAFDILLLVCGGCRDGDCTLRFQMNDPEKPDPHAVVEGAPTEYVAGYVSGGPTPSNLLPQVGGASLVSASCRFAIKCIHVELKVLQYAPVGRCSVLPHVPLAITFNTANRQGLLPVPPPAELA